MNKSAMKVFFRFISLFLLVLLASPVLADFSQDLSLGAGDLRAPASVIQGQTVRIYATVHDNSSSDLTGTVKFYDENTQSFVGENQPTTVVAGRTDDVFVDFTGVAAGLHTIAVRVIPWLSEGDDPSNNQSSITINVVAPKKTPAVPKPVISHKVSTPSPAPVASTAQPQPVNTAKETVANTVTVDKASKGPVAVLTAEKTMARAGQPLTFSALRSNDPNGDIVSYQWDFGDGQKESGVLVDHIFKTPGNYKVDLKVTNNIGEEQETSVMVKITTSWQVLALVCTTVLLVLLLLVGILLRRKGKKDQLKKPLKKKNLPKRKK